MTQHEPEAAAVERTRRRCRRAASSAVWHASLISGATPADRRLSSQSTECVVSHGRDSTTQLFYFPTQWADNARPVELPVRPSTVVRSVGMSAESAQYQRCGVVLAPDDDGVCGHWHKAPVRWWITTLVRSNCGLPHTVCDKPQFERTSVRAGALSVSRMTADPRHFRVTTTFLYRLINVLFTSDQTTGREK